MNPMLFNGLSSSKFLKGSRTKTTQQVAKLVEDLILYLNTPVGTLFGRPDYGTRLQEYLFEPTTTTTGEAIRQEVVRAVQRSYPTLKLQTVDIKFLRSGENENIDGINVNIYYSINQNGMIQMLDFDILRERS